jgi:hypothetical protein
MDLGFPPDYETNPKTRETANGMGCFCSFINVDTLIDYDAEYIKSLFVAKP